MKPREERNGKGEGGALDLKSELTSEVDLVDIIAHRPQVSVPLTPWNPGRILGCWCKDCHPKKGVFLSLSSEQMFRILYAVNILTK